MERNLETSRNFLKLKGNSLKTIYCKSMERIIKNLSRDFKNNLKITLAEAHDTPRDSSSPPVSKLRCKSTALRIGGQLSVSKVHRKAALDRAN